LPASALTSRQRPHEVLATALWVMMAWVHAIAHWSVYLVITAPDKDCGKTTLLIDVIGRLAPRPAAYGSNPTPASIFRLADREHPSMLFDNVDTLFASRSNCKADVTDLFLFGWTRDIPVRREIGGKSVAFDVFCPKAVTLIGTNIPEPLLTRCLLIELTRPLPGEELVEVDPHNRELLELFKILKRKLARWAKDNIDALKSATPLFPAGLVTRPKANAKLLLAIAELAGDEWAGMAHTALDRLLREEREPSWLERLLQELWIVFAEEKRKDIESEQLVRRLTNEPTSEWCNYHGKRVNQWDVSALLRRLHIKTHLVGARRRGGYRAQDFFENEIFERWLRREPPKEKSRVPPQTKSKSKSRSRKTKKPSRSRKGKRGG
jgi:putative DNA primase/helicase